MKKSLKEIYDDIKDIDESIDKFVIMHHDNQVLTILTTDNMTELIATLIIEMHENPDLATFICVAADGYHNGPQPPKNFLQSAKNIN